MNYLTSVRHILASLSLLLFVFTLAPSIFAHYDEAASSEHYTFDIAVDPTFVERFPSEITLDVTFYAKGQSTILKNVSYAVEVTAPDGNKHISEGLAPTGLTHEKYNTRIEGEHAMKITLRSIQGRPVTPESVQIRFPITGPSTPQPASSVSTTTSSAVTSITTSSTTSQSPANIPPTESPKQTASFLTDSYMLMAVSVGIVLVVALFVLVSRRRSGRKPM